MLSTEAWGLCNDYLFYIETMELCSDDYIIIASFHKSCYFRWLCGDHVVIHFIHLLINIHPLSMMYLLRTIYRLFYYWAHSIASDVFAVGLASKVIYYLVNYNIRVSFFFNFLGYTYTLASFFGSYSMVLTMSMTFLSEIWSSSYVMSAWSLESGV